MVLDTARPRYKENTTWLGMRGRDAARKLTLKVNILQVFTIDFSERSSLSWITTRNRMVRTILQRVGWTCERRPYIQTHSRGKEKIQRTMVSYSRQSRQKWACEASTWLQSSLYDERSFAPWIRRTNWRAHPSRSTKQGPTHRMTTLAFISKFWYASEWSWKWAHNFFSNLFFVTVGFVYSWQRSTVADGECEQNTSHRDFSRTFICTHFILVHMHRNGLKVLHDVSCKKSVSSTCYHVSDCSLSLFALISSSLSSVSTFCPFSSSPLSWTSSSMSSKPPSTKSIARPQNEEYCPVVIYNPLTGYEPNQLDNSDCAETSALIFQHESVDIDTEPSYSCDAVSLSEKRCLHHCSFRSEKNQRTWDKLITLMKQVCCPLSPLLHAPVRWDPYTNQVQNCLKNGNQVATWETSESGFSLKDKESKFLLKSDLRSRSTNFKASLTKRSIQELTGIINSQNWSYYYTTSRRTIRTKSGSLWNSYQECARHGRIAEKSRVKGRGILKKNIDWRPKHNYGAESQNSRFTELSHLYEWLLRF